MLRERGPAGIEPATCKSNALPRAALRLVRARVLCQMRAPYRPVTS